jgi:hypothetical protein
LTRNVSPNQLIVRLVGYYLVLGVVVTTLLSVNADALKFLPFAGSDALEIPGIQITGSSISLEDGGQSVARDFERTPKSLALISLFLATTLLTTIVAMIPVTWTFSATRFESGPSKVFVRALILLPVCAATVVLLIQDSLALAFGLAALVAAVRFRVSLPEAIDGIYIFTAVCVGLAGGIGYMGVALIMTMIFTLAHAVMWKIEYGRNPMDDVRQEAARAKLAAKVGGQPPL